MATTKSLNSDDSVWVTTFNGGEEGRSYLFTVNINGIQVSTTVTEEQFMGMLVLNGGKAVHDDGVRPVFDDTSDSRTSQLEEAAKEVILAANRNADEGPTGWAQAMSTLSELIFPIKTEEE